MSKKGDQIDFGKTDRYNWHPSGIECIDVAEGFDFVYGNVIKCVWRAADPNCDPEERLDSLQKAERYLLRKIVKAHSDLIGMEMEELNNDDGAGKADIPTIHVHID